MGRKRRRDGPGRIFHITARVNWRVWHLLEEKARRLLARLIREQALAFDVAVLAYVFMANHFHLVTVSPEPKLYRAHTSRRTACRHRQPFPRGHQNASVVSQFMREVRRTMSKLRQHDLGLTGKFWEGDYDARLVESPESLLVRIAYDHRNPVKAGIVERPEDYLWSSARTWRSGEPGPIPLSLDSKPLGLGREELVESVLRFEGWEDLDEFMPTLIEDGIEWDSEFGHQAILEFLERHGEK